MKNQIRENLWQDCETKLDLQRACLKLSFIVVVHMPVLSTEWEKCYFSCSGFWYFKKAISITFSRFFFFFSSQEENSFQPGQDFRKPHMTKLKGETGIYIFKVRVCLVLSRGSSHFSFNFDSAFTVANP